ncbi:MAG: hypothetical protein A2934_01115 [Candidatus Sungbacteria bacterium RIFCSPLOWO2_01_FULL_47_10]|uniref:Prepilin-type N-terminal cleavage/methylation domain-containing protein n=1 Tax=Candidatus Sungbacteria bacterium RIFCSPLOWO2_01_FULL_47_10 TaxID=1802276 RepID=A0A1G2L5E9_9BACT|nr:MAG: hypothetical protein A2934_01115 [Candidatus Sungbacteria bacterium RIFCSPLOWO2_01_FULL_47_10]
MKGISLIEVAIGTAIISSILLALGSVAQYSLHLSKNSTLRLQAVFLASEGVEAVKTLRDSGWSANIAPLNAGTDYYVVFETDHYVTTTSPPALIDGLFQQKIVFENTNRDANDDIVESGGVADPNTKKVSVTVSWNYRNVAREETIRTYVANMFND